MSREPEVLCVVQARMGSSRLPGKVLAPVGQQSMLRFLLRRLGGLGGIPIVVATTSDERDNPVADEAIGAGASVVRGSEHDVLARFRLAADDYPTDHVIRITADCPLTDPAIVRAVVARHRQSGADYTSNVLPRTFPKGLDVEVMTAKVLRVAASTATIPAEREHVTPFLYRHPERFRLANLRNGVNLGDERWTVDTPEDLKFIQGVAAQIEPDAPWQQILELVGARASPPSHALRLRPAEIGDGPMIRAFRNDADAIRFSSHHGPVSLNEHEEWLAARIENPATRLYVAELDEAVIGQVRVDVADATGTVSIAVAASHRGRGHAAAMLRLLQQQVRAELQVDTLLASIHPANGASRRLFAGAGFAPSVSQGGFEILSWNRDRDWRTANE